MNNCFVIYEECNYEDSRSVICVCSTKEKLEKAMEILKAKNKNPDVIYYSYDEVIFDCLNIYL